MHTNLMFCLQTQEGSDQKKEDKRTTIKNLALVLNKQNSSRGSIFLKLCSHSKGFLKLA